MDDFLNKTFHLAESNTTVRTEILAGLTTFMTMSYIIFVQPAVLSTTGMDFGAVMAATCIISAFSTYLMAFLANYPIAVAPAMGHNFFFAFTVVAAMGYSWQTALGAVVIGLLITLVGLEWSGLVAGSPGTLVTLGNMRQPAVLMSAAGILVTLILLVRRFRGAILAGILTSTVIGLFLGVVRFHGIVS